jgi:O-antigen/teichoic acid export membrane protein
VALAEAWQYGRWSLGGVSITWIQSQSYAYFLAVLSGTSSVAEANAARLLFAPASIIATSMMNVFMPRMVRLKTAGNLSAAVKLGRKALLFLLAVTAFYAGAVLICSDWLITTVFTKQYSTINVYIVTWMIVILLQAVRANSSALLQIVREFKAIMLANAASALVVIATTSYLINTYGAVGSIAALAIGEAVLAALLWRIFHRVRTAYPR